MMRLFLGLSIVLIGLGCGRSPSSTPEDYTSAAGGFKVRFPGKPKESETPLPPPLTGTAKLLTAEVNGVAYTANFMDFGVPIGPDQQSKSLNGARDGAVANTKGKLVSEKSISLGANQPGREIVINAGVPQGSIVIRQRFFLAGSRLYQVLVVATSEARTRDEMANNFLESFKLTK